MRFKTKASNMFYTKNRNICISGPIYEKYKSFANANSIFLIIPLIWLYNKMAKNKKNKDESNKANALVNKCLCNFIAEKFLHSYHNQNGEGISQNKYAISCGLSSSTLTKLKDPDGYEIPLSTIYNICRYERYSLKNLFTEFEEKYGINIPL